MAKPLFKEATFWLNKICVLPYSDEELDAIGCLGFDMAKNKDFANKYMAELLERRMLINQNKRIPFSALNLQLYRRVLEQQDLKQIPDWIVMPDKAAMTDNSIKVRILKMSENIKNNKEKTSMVQITNTRK